MNNAINGLIIARAASPHKKKAARLQTAYRVYITPIQLSALTTSGAKAIRPAFASHPHRAAAPRGEPNRAPCDGGVMVTR
jgi:hypothetical protein